MNIRRIVTAMISALGIPVAMAGAQTGTFYTVGIGSQPDFRIAPMVRFERGRNGLAVLVVDAAGYVPKLHDLRGAALPLHAQSSAGRWFIPAGSVPAAGVLSVWKGGNRVRDLVLGGR
jgi:hypothetical protein